MSYITRYSRIKDRSLFHQGELAYEKKSGSLDDFLESAFSALSITYPKFYKMDRLSKLGFLATEFLVRDSQLMQRYKPQQVALVLSNAHASLDTDLHYFQSTKSVASPALFVYTLTNIVAGELCIRHGITGENAFFVCPQFDAAQLCDYVDLVLATEKTGACIAGWVDVIGDDHDVFLYLVEKQKQKNALEHSAEELRKLYQLKYGTVDGRS
jgi:hypothetical protein